MRVQRKKDQKHLLLARYLREQPPVSGDKIRARSADALPRTADSSGVVPVRIGKLRLKASAAEGGLLDAQCCPDNS